MERGKLIKRARMRNLKLFAERRYYGDQRNPKKRGEKFGERSQDELHRKGSGGSGSGNWVLSGL